MSNFQTEDFKFDHQVEERKNKTGEKIKTTKTKIRVDTEDLFVFGGILIAVILVLGMVFEKIPANKLTITAIGVSSIAAGVAQIRKARKGKKS